MRRCAFLICLHGGKKMSGQQSKQWNGWLMNGSLCRVRDPSEAAKDHRGGGGRTRQVAMAGEPLLQQPPHLWWLHHHQPMGCHGRSLCAQVRLSAWKQVAWHACRALLSQRCPLRTVWNGSYRLPQVSSWVVYAGIVTRSSAKMAQHAGHAVEKIIYNVDYNHRSHDGDIALMKLRTPLNFSGGSGSPPPPHWGAQ